uniref:DUF4378 domain-containing protein n=1 Tax=Davidia involucrata TaxID=16924 RepID=A0A5B7BX22_DAVIN
MASLNFSDSKPLPKPALMLKDYLLDDLSSCSSNGFRSYPRRQCCTTVRFLLEIDLKTRDSSNHSKRLLISSKSKAASSTTVSALQRASEAVINAVKLLPFPSVKSPSSQKQKKPNKKAILPRSLSRKIWRRSFWKKTDKEIQRWKSFRDLLEEKQLPSDFSPSITTISTSHDSNSNGNSWSDSDFTSDYLQCSSGNSENSCENDVVESTRHLPEKVVSKRVGVEATTTTNSVENTKWPNEEEKELFSPVSVLDFPFDIDEDEASSPFQCTLARMEGTKQNVMQKIRRFESLAQLEPVDLEKRMALSELSDESLESPLQTCSVSIQGSLMFDKEQEENETEQKAKELLKLMKATIPSSNHLNFNAYTLLLDFFRERITNEFNYELLSVAKDWMNGHPSELLMEWEVQRNRQAYIRDMEKGGRWRKLDEDIEEVVMELEVEVFASLMNELLLDLF